MIIRQGNWILGKEHGKGVLMSGDRKVIYSGDFADGYFHGTGHCYYGNGDEYCGEMREGIRHGEFIKG